MRKKPIDSGEVPAFPIPEDTNFISHTGMTMRQWYAGQALSGPLMDQGENPEKAARYAFQYADAMIAHEKGEE